jgi:hypothetical protein
MDDLSQLMETLFLVSKSIPEGEYVNMCTNMKNIHIGLKTKTYRNQLELERKRKQLKALKLRKNITETVKHDAIKEHAHRLGFRLRSYTIESIREKGVRIQDERSFYKSYIDRHNLLMRDTRRNLELDIEELEI